MALPIIFTWPVLDTAGISALQNTAGAANLLINGTLAVSINGSNEVIFNGIARTVSLTSANNLSARNFTVTGTLDGFVQAETIAGPNANTVETTKLFSSITSVAVNGAVNQVSVGSGSKGKTNWFNYNYQSIYSNLVVQVERVATTINYTLEVTLDDVQTFSYENILTFSPIGALTGATTSQLGNYTVPTRYANITINSSDATGNLIATFLQQGVR